MKQRIIALLTTGLLILSLAGCAAQNTTAQTLPESVTAGGAARQLPQRILPSLPWEWRQKALPQRRHARRMQKRSRRRWTSSPVWV